MHMPQSRGVRLTSALAVSPAVIFLRVAASAVTAYWDSGAASLAYQTLVTPLILRGISSLALKKASHWAGVASLMEVRAKQCINFFSPACAMAGRVRAAAKAAARRRVRLIGRGYPRPEVSARPARPM